MDQSRDEARKQVEAETTERDETQPHETPSPTGADVCAAPDGRESIPLAVASTGRRNGVFRAAGIWCISGPGVALAQWLQAAAVIGAAITLVYSDISLKQQRTEFTLRYATEFNETHLSDLALFRQTLPNGVGSIEEMNASQVSQARVLIQEREQEASSVLLFLSGFIDCYDSGLCNKSLTRKTLCQPTDFYKTRVLDFLAEHERPSQFAKISKFLNGAC